MGLANNGLERVNNKDSAFYVRNQYEFQGSNMYGINLEGQNHRTYVVYSYGTHFPMFVWDYNTFEWYENTDRFSRTTSKQQNQCRPEYGIPLTNKFDTDAMKQIATMGYNGFIAQRLGVDREAA